MNYIPEIVQVIPHKDFSVHVFFHDGKITCYDMSGKVGKGVFKELKDPQVFMDTCTILNDTLAWDLEGNRDCRKCIDIDPDTLYEAEEISYE